MYKIPGEAAFTGGIAGVIRERLRVRIGIKSSTLNRETGRVFKFLTENEILKNETEAV
jgi:hypothetical protein